MEHKKATQVLKRKLGQAVLVDEEALYRASFDGSKVAFRPEAVIQPKRPEEVGDLLVIANRHKVPVTTRGAGSSLTGSAAPVRGGWVLDVSKLNRIRIDRTTGMAYVQAGAVTGRIQEAAEKAGWFYPPDPASKNFSTIGGNIACNAGGMRGSKYGVTRDYVLALSGFLPSGEPVRWARDLRKFASGYNMRDLWIGSEGTLGVMTDAVLRLIPKPEKTWTFLASFPSEAKALAAVKELIGQQINPSILEFLDRESVACAERATGAEIFAGQAGKPVLLLECDGRSETVKEDRKAVLAWGRKHAAASREASSPKAAEELWAVRRKCSGAMFALGDSKINVDVVIPLRNQTRFVQFVRKLGKESGVSIACFGHAADGNFHVNIMYNRDASGQFRLAEKAVFVLMKQVVDLSGSISGEHGIGLAKTPFLRLEHTEAEIAAMRAIKKALDPNDILNPGKIFDVFDFWSRRPEKVRLPWDKR